MKKIILDVDPGHDDAVAIMFAAASNEIDILGITCVAGNSILENTTQNALKICSFIDRTDINIYAGSNKPLKRKLVTASHVHGENGLEHSGDEIIIPNKYKLQEKDAVDFIVDSCIQNKGITLCPTGPLTNIAKAILKEPHIVNNINEIVFMGGAAMTLGNITPAAEFNIYVDPHAANIVFNSQIPLVMMGLDVTHKVLVDDTITNDILSIGNKSSKLFRDLINFYSIFHKEKYDTTSSPLHDPCVIGYILNNKLFSGKKANLIVEENSELTMGQTVVDWLEVSTRTKNCLIVNDVDSDNFFKLLKDKFSLLP